MIISVNYQVHIILRNRSNYLCCRGHALKYLTSIFGAISRKDYVTLFRYILQTTRSVILGMHQDTPTLHHHTTWKRVKILADKGNLLLVGYAVNPGYEQIAPLVLYGLAEQENIL